MSKIERFDYSKLRGKIKEKYNRQADFAKAMDISSTSLSDKLNNKADFTQSEIQLAFSLLDVKAEEIGDYFFTV